MFPTRSDRSRDVQPQKIARGLKFQSYEVEGLYHLCSENKGTAQLCGNNRAAAQLCGNNRPADLICAFVFAYESRFSHILFSLRIPAA